MRRPDDKLYGNPMFGIQVTGNSNSIRAFWKPLRVAGAAARAMLVQAAAAQWQVDPASCSAAAGKVTHAASGRIAAYGELVDAASALPCRRDPRAQGPEGIHTDRQAAQALRHAQQDRRQGRLRHRCDAARHEVRDIGAKPGVRRQGRACRRQRRQEDAGVRQIVVLDDLVAVVGDHFWAAKTGLDALAVTWDEGANAKVNSSDIWNDLRAASRKDGVVAKSVGDVDKGLTEGERVDADYELPFLAHATMEPQNCTVALTPGACEIWTGTQVITRVKATAAEAAGVPIDKVTVHNHYIGGGFGRRLEADMVAARCASPTGRWAGEGDVDPRRGHAA